MGTEQTTTPDRAPGGETPKLRIEYGMLVEEVDRCTCGAGGEHGHEPGCGLDPWMPVSVLVADLAELARVRPVVDAAREVAESWDDGKWGTGPRGTGVMQKLTSTVETADILADPDTVAAIAEGEATGTDEMRWSPADVDAAATPQTAAVFGPATECTCGHPVAHHDLEHTFCKAALPDLSGPCPCMRFAVAALDGTRLR